jgi:hypothetical protein
MSKYTYVQFTNPTNRDFTAPFDREPYTVKAGQSEYFPPFLAKHLAKRLADREMILEHGRPMHNEPPRNAFVLKCLNIESEKTLEKIESISLKSRIEEERAEMAEKGLLSVTEEEITAEEEEGSLMPRETATRKKQNNDVEFSGELAAASAKLRSKIPSPEV